MRIIRNVKASGWKNDKDRFNLPCKKFWLNWEVVLSDGEIEWNEKFSAMWLKNRDGKVFGPFACKGKYLMRAYDNSIKEAERIYREQKRPLQEDVPEIKG